MNKAHTLEDCRHIGKNFMTPKVIDYVLTKDNRIIEIAKGEGFDGSDIWGVTEFAYEGKRLETTRRGQMHTSIQSARKHYKVLVNEPA